MVQEVAHEMIKSGINDYLISGFEGVLYGIGFTIMGAILIDMCINKKNSFMVRKLNKILQSTKRGE